MITKGKDSLESSVQKKLSPTQWLMKITTAEDILRKCLIDWSCRKRISNWLAQRPQRISPLTFRRRSLYSNITRSSGQVNTMSFWRKATTRSTLKQSPKQLRVKTSSSDLKLTLLEMRFSSKRMDLKKSLPKNSLTMRISTRIVLR